ncbi:MAG TPA: BTAD domain-containing putative transcriptional regulator [Gemmatimonadaceae bacterium]|nr:BTAD domain-containing putative transcriptional regulator [Gemmatimonadaceae bacterium]
MTTSATRALFLFGSLELRAPEGSDTRQILSRPKVIALLAYLAVPSVGRFVRRDTLVGLLWPVLDQAHARAALRKALQAVRTALGRDAALARGDEEVALSTGALWCDAAAFTAAADSGALSRALELYRGELLPGFHLSGCGDFDQWLEAERTAAAERASAAAWALAQRQERESALSDAARSARRAVRFSWSDERTLRRAVLMLDRLGDRAGALRLFDEFARRLRAEFEVAPSAETIALINSLRE